MIIELKKSFKPFPAYKPQEGTIVIAKIDSGKLIPAFYYKGEFATVRDYCDGEGLKTQHRLCSVASWIYEMELEETTPAHHSETE